MLYTKDYIADSIETFAAQFEKDYEQASYDINVDGSFNNVPVVELVRFLDKSGDKDYQDLMVRHSILGKQITIILDGDQVGAFTLNGLDDTWAAIPVFNEHPMAYLALANVVMGYLGKKCTLPRKKASKVEAVATKK